MNPGRTAVWSRWTTRRFSTLQCVSSANRTDNICSPDFRIRACGSAGLFCAAGRPPSPRPEFFLSAAVTSFRRRFIRAADRPPCHRPVYLLCRRPSFSLPVHPCRRPALSPSAAVPSFRRRFIRAAGPAPCPRPELSLFCRRPSFSPPVHPRRRPAPCPRPVYLLLRAAGWPSFCQNARSRNANLPCRAAILPFC